MNNDELYHHGIIGMKWGVRRYQNKDGSLTPAGRKRAAKLASEYSKVTGENISSSKSSASSPKTIKEMSNEELSARIERLRLEQTYLQLTSTSKKTTSGEKIVNGLKNTSINIVKSRGSKIAGDIFEAELRKAIKKRGIQNEQ